MIPVLTLLRGTRQRNFCKEIQNRASFVVVNTYLRKTDVKRGVPSAFGGRNHFAKACRKANVKQVETSSRYSNSYDSDYQHCNFGCQYSQRSGFAGHSFYKRDLHVHGKSKPTGQVLKWLWSVSKCYHERTYRQFQTSTDVQTPG